MSKGIDQWYKKGDRVQITGMGKEDVRYPKRDRFIGRTGTLYKDVKGSHAGNFLYAWIDLDGEDYNPFIFGRVRLKKL